MPFRSPLVLVGYLKDKAVLERPAYYLETDGHAVSEVARNGDGGMTCIIYKARIAGQEGRHSLFGTIVESVLGLLQFGCRYGAGWGQRLGCQM